MITTMALNDGGAGFPGAAAAQKEFCDFFQVPANSPRRTTPGVYDCVTLGPVGKRVQLILLDTRAFRSPLKKDPTKPKITIPNTDPDATMLGEGQWAWFERRLREPAEIRVVVSSIQFISTEHGSEKWGNFPKERARFLELLRRTQAKGVVVISGDRHMAELSALTPADGAPYPLYDLTTSGLNQPIPEEVRAQGRDRSLPPRSLSPIVTVFTSVPTRAPISVSCGSNGTVPIPPFAWKSAGWRARLLFPATFHSQRSARSEAEPRSAQKTNLSQSKSAQQTPYRPAAVTARRLHAADRSKPPAKPNIVILLVDDMGYGDPRCYNPQSKIATPNIDRLAREGMRFTDAHAPGPLCHPSRYGLMTGRYPFRTDISRWPKQPLIEKGQVTIASLLRDQGYHTAMVGKWHLGFREEGYDQPLRGGPVDCGFDSFFGLRASTDISPYFYIRGDRAVTPPTEHIAEHHSEGWAPNSGGLLAGRRDRSRLGTERRSAEAHGRSLRRHQRAGRQEAGRAPAADALPRLSRRRTPRGCQRRSLPEKAARECMATL